MKKVIRITVIFLCIVFIGVIGFKMWSAKLVKEAMELEDVSLDLSNVKVEEKMDVENLKASNML